MNKRAIYAISGVALAGLAGFLYWRYKNKQKKTSPTSPIGKITVITDNAPINAGTINPNQVKTTQSGSVTPVGKQISADTILKDGPGAIVGRMLIAKYNGAGIYDTSFNKVGNTIIGNHLGMATSATQLTKGSYNITFKDTQGNDRIVNSVSVNVII